MPRSLIPRVERSVHKPRVMKTGNIFSWRTQTLLATIQIRLSFFSAIFLLLLVLPGVPGARAGMDPVFLALQTPSRTQGPRNVCVIFSVTALMEAYLLNHHGLKRDDANLSEEWLSYVV